MKTSEQINELAAALATAQAKMPTAKMNAVNPFLKNRYADLGAVIDALNEGLNGTGLSYVQFPATPPVEFGPAIALTTRVMHESGQWLEDTYIMNVPAEERGKSSMQVAGSAITYARRYALAAVFGIVADEDADGNAPTSKPQNQRQERATPRQATNGHPPPEVPVDGENTPLDAARIADLRATIDGSGETVKIGFVFDRLVMAGLYSHVNHALNAAKQWDGWPDGYTVKIGNVIKTANGLRLYDWLVERKAEASA